MKYRGEGNFATMIVAFSLVLFVVATCSGCSTAVPIKAKFPDVPEELKEKCPQLKTIPGETTVFSELTKTVVGNYTLYHECAAKQEAWLEWYNSQKQIFESVK